MAEVFVSIGSNEDREMHISAGLKAMRDLFGNVQLSPIYETPAVGFEGDPFLNFVAAFETELTVGDLSIALKKIEAENGRNHKAAKFSSRTLDIDILTYDSLVGEFDGVVLPRDEILKYAFVLGPLADLVPNYNHPEIKKSYRELWSDFQGDKAGLKLVDVSFKQ